MQLVLSERVQDELHILNPYERQKVQVWIDYLRNWETDASVRERSVKLEVQGREEYMFRTTTDLRIFYSLDEKKNIVTVIDVTTRQTILRTNGVSTEDARSVPRI